MKTSSWTRLTLNTEREYSDLAAQALLDIGCGGVQIEDTRLEDRGEDAAFLETPQVVVIGFFENLVDENTADALRAALDEYSVTAELSIETIADEQWSTSWRANFPPLQIGLFLITPTWEEVPAESELIPIRLDPGLAFGTGQHPTTHMCLELLGERASTLSGARLLDVGCGSGVLSIAATKLGARCIASDLDPHCIAATRENAELNEVDIEVVEVAGLSWCNEKFDVVIANLMSDLLISLADEIARVCAPGSTLIVSGISSPRADDVQNALQSAGFTTCEKHEKDGEQRGEIQERWAAFVMSKS